MLTNVTIEGFRTLKGRLELELKSGLTVITGETGAGKSLLVDAVATALCQKVSRSHSHDLSGFISLEFRLPPENGVWEVLGEALGEAGAARAETVVLTVKGGARRRYSVSGKPVGQAVVQELAPQLCGFHQQNDHLNLLKREYVQAWFDAVVGISWEVEALASLRQKHRSVSAKILALQEAEATSGDRLRELEVELQAFEVAAEDLEDVEGLFETFERLKQGKKQIQALVDARQALVQSQGVMGVLSSVSAKLEQAEVSRGTILSPLDQAMDSVREGVEGLEEALNDLAEAQYSYDAVQERVSTLHGLARRHQVDVFLLQKKYQALAEEQEMLSTLGPELKKLREEGERLRKEKEKLASHVQQVRQDQAPSISSALTLLMSGLGMEGREFRFELTGPRTGKEAQKEARKETGKDIGKDIGKEVARGAERGAEVEACEVYLAVGLASQIASGSNPDTFQPIDITLSGGELSRLALALQVVKAQNAEEVDQQPCQFLDEVDVGVGGQVAMYVGACLKSQSSRGQTVIITHQPHVAVHADHHLLVEKSVDGGAHQFSWLGESSRVGEVARMLGSHKKLPEAEKHAQALVERATAIVAEVGFAKE